MAEKVTTNTKIQHMVPEGAEDATYSFDEVSQMIDEGCDKRGISGNSQNQEDFFRSDC